MIKFRIVNRIRISISGDPLLPCHYETSCMTVESSSCGLDHKSSEVAIFVYE